MIFESTLLIIGGYLLGSISPTYPWCAGLAGRICDNTGAMILLTLLKRLEGNRRPWPSSRSERLEVLIRRAFLDRDIASHEKWIRRQPGREDEWMASGEGQKGSVV